MTDPLDYHRKQNDLFSFLRDVCGAQGEIAMSPDRPQVSSIVFGNVPETEFSTSFTFGLSLFEHREWGEFSPELIFSAKTFDPRWHYAVLETISERGKSDPFLPGSVFRLGGKVSNESEMSALLVAAPENRFNAENEYSFDDGRKIRFLQCYPIFAQEAELVKTCGPDKFLLLCGDKLPDLRRKPCPVPEWPETPADLRR